MDTEETLMLYESCWFEMEIFKNRSSSSKPNQNPDEKIRQISSKQHITHRRSVSDDLSAKTSDFSSESLSPNTTLSTRKLQTIFSGKEARPFEEQEEGKPRVYTEEMERSKIGENRGGKRRRRKQGRNKSLSDLEFEEVKGFMDLGFVFTQEDKNSEVGEMIPGIHRLFLGRRDEDAEEHKSGISRPYLSEAWEVINDGKIKEERTKTQLVFDLRFPALSNEMNIKDNLRLWAHTVASTVK